MHWNGTMEKPRGRCRWSAESKAETAEMEHQGSGKGSGQESLAGHAKGVEFDPRITGKALKVFS